MRLHASWMIFLPAFALSVACAETRTPTELAAGSARFETSVTTTTAECVAQIDALIARTTDPVSTPISGKNAESKERPGLIATLTAARSLLETGKPADAVKKLEDYIVKVQQLVAAGRLAPDVGSALINDAQSAITCIQSAGV